MKAKVITLFDDKDSVSAAEHCIESAKSSGLIVEKFKAVTPSETFSLLIQLGIEWNYPWNGEQIFDLQTGLVKTGYNTVVKEKRIACFLSHYLLWKECKEKEEDIIVFEHDAHVEHSIPLRAIESSNKTIIALNRPQGGCTPKADLYQMRVNSQIPQGINNTSPARVVQIPYINEDRRHPAGLPGNSAYYIKPKGAKKLLSLVKQYGAWPNDAIMCKQLLPGELGIVWPAATRVNRSKSTTTL